MLTLPKIVERDPQAYVAVRRSVTIPFGEAIGPAVGELQGWMRAHGIAGSGPLFFNYERVKMPELDIAFGFPVAKAVKADGPIVAGTLPGGRYATLTYWGHYDNLEQVTSVLIGWARQNGIEWDSTTDAGGDHFACRLEIYNNDMNENPPDKWETVLAFKVK